MKWKGKILILISGAVFLCGACRNQSASENVKVTDTSAQMQLTQEKTATASMETEIAEQQELSEIDQKIKEFKENMDSQVTMVQDLLRGVYRLGDLSNFEGDIYSTDSVKIGDVEVDYDTASKYSRIIFTNDEFLISYAEADVQCKNGYMQHLRNDITVSGIYRVVSPVTYEDGYDACDSDIELLVTSVSPKYGMWCEEQCDALQAIVGKIYKKHVRFWQVYMDLRGYSKKKLKNYDLELHEPIEGHLDATWGYREDGSYGLIRLEHPIKTIENPITNIFFGSESDRELMSFQCRMKTRVTLDGIYDGVEPGVYFEDLKPQLEKNITENTEDE